MDLQEVKEFLRVSIDDEDSLITSLIQAAEIYLKNSGVISSEENQELYNLTLKLLVSHLYENRSISTTSQNIGFGLQSLIIQLKQN